ncbi:MAG TPA: proteasome activator [Acidimicrobiales bacterium]|nr:proteasome activator [Acidimicrobiales bacterium]
MTDADAQTDTTDDAAPGTDGTETVERGELIEASAGEEQGEREAVQEPGRVMRIGAMIRQLLEEVRSAELDEAGRERLREIYDQSVKELSGALSDDLAEELHRLASPFGDTPASAGELRVAQAQLVGWLEGLFHGIQATLFAQQAAARQQLEQMRHQLESGQRGASAEGAHPPGTYL